VVIKRKKSIYRRTFNCFVEYNLLTVKSGGDMRALKKIMRMLLKYLIIVIIVSAIGAVIAYMISYKTGMEFQNTLEYAGIILMLLGALSVLGNRKILSSYRYNITKFAVDVQKSTRSDIDMKFDSYRFTIITGLSGLILLIISLAIWKY
jgi:hypothetical protein